MNWNGFEVNLTLGAPDLYPIRMTAEGNRALRNQSVRGSFIPYWELSGVPSAKPWHLLISSSGLQPFPPLHRFVSLRGYCPTLLFTISSSSIDSPYNSYSAYLLPTIQLGNMPYIRTNPIPLRVVAVLRLCSNSMMTTCHPWPSLR